MDHPDNRTTEVLVVVSFPELETKASEDAWEQGILDAVSTAVYADKTLDIIAVRQLEYADCQWVFEGGMPIPEYDVTVGQNGSWHSGVDPFAENPEASGEDLQSLFEYLVERGLVKK